jgi:hypothetical protein
MTAIHFIERVRNQQRIDASQHEWESGYWKVSAESAETLVGGEIYFHTSQVKPSYFGGKIISYRVQSGGPDDGRVIFRFRAALEFKGVLTTREGWGNEKKIVR